MGVCWGGEGAAKWALQVRFGGEWRTAAVVPVSTRSLDLPPMNGALPDALAVSAVDRYGNSGRAAVVGR